MALTIGNKYYKVNEDKTVEIIRLTKIEDEQLSLVRESDKKELSIKKDDLHDKYTLLNPDGYMSFSIVSLENKMKDIIVTLHRKSDINENSDCLPYAVCRQNIVDIFMGFIDPMNTHIGLSINQDDCPVETEMDNILECSDVLKMKIIAVYLDDNPYDIISFINTEEYDNTLKELKEIYELNPCVYGCVDNLKSLLVSNEFINDFASAFDIMTLDFELSINKNNEISEQQIQYIEKYIGYQMITPFVIKYSKDINMRNIKKDYKLIMDKTNTVYLLVYEKGKRVLYYQ